MKKLFFAFLILLSGAAAGAEPMARLVSYNVNRPRFLAPKLARGQEISYCTYLSKDALAVTDMEDFDKTIRLAIKLWTVYPAYLIRQAGREREFAPVLQALDQTPQLKRLPACDFSEFDKKHLHLLNPKPANTQAPRADVSYFFENRFFAKQHNVNTISPYFTLTPIPHVLVTSQVEKSHANAATWPDTPAEKARMFKDLRERILQTPNSDHQKMDGLIKELTLLYQDFGPASRSLLYTLLHETGHAVGLADQHKQVNNDRIYTTINTRRSVMDYATRFLTCDDADGVITLLDDALGIKRDFESLCKDGIAFSNGKELFKGTKKSTLQTRNLYSAYTYREDTKDTGIVDWEEKLYVNLGEESAKDIDPKFDLTVMEEEWGGYQTATGALKFIDLEDTSKGNFPVGELRTKLSLGPGPVYKQILTEHYDNNGNLLDYTLEIYDTETDTVAETRFKKVK